MKNRFKIYQAVFLFFGLCQGISDPLSFSDRFVERLAANPAFEPDELEEVQRLILRRLGEPYEAHDSES